MNHKLPIIKCSKSLKDIKYDINHFTNRQKVGLGSYQSNGCYPLNEPSTTFVATKTSILVKGPPVEWHYNMDYKEVYERITGLRELEDQRHKG